MLRLVLAISLLVTLSWCSCGPSFSLSSSTVSSSSLIGSSDVLVVSASLSEAKARKLAYATGLRTQRNGHSPSSSLLKLPSSCPPFFFFVVHELHRLHIIIIFFFLCLYIYIYYQLISFVSYLPSPSPPFSSIHSFHHFSLCLILGLVVRWSGPSSSTPSSVPLVTQAEGLGFSALKEGESMRQKSIVKGEGMDAVVNAVEEARGKGFSVTVVADRECGPERNTLQAKPTTGK